MALPHSLKTADQVAFTFSAVFYFSGEGNIATIICYNGLMKSDFVEKMKKGESHGKKK